MPWLSRHPFTWNSIVQISILKSCSLRLMINMHAKYKGRAKAAIYFHCSSSMLSKQQDRLATRPLKNDKWYLTLPLRWRSHSKVCLKLYNCPTSTINLIKTKHSEKVAAFIKINSHLKKQRMLSHLAKPSVLCIAISVIQIFGYTEWAWSQWIQI